MAFLRVLAFGSWGVFCGVGCRVVIGKGLGAEGLVVLVFLGFGEYRVEGLRAGGIVQGFGLSVPKI